MPIVALLNCIFNGWVVGPKVISDEVKLSSGYKREKLFIVIVKYVAPIFILAILISSVLNSFGIIKL